MIRWCQLEKGVALWRSMNCPHSTTAEKAFTEKQKLLIMKTGFLSFWAMTRLLQDVMMVKLNSSELIAWQLQGIKKNSRNSLKGENKMLFYKAKKECCDYFTGNTLIENELLTARERNTKFRYIPDSYFDIVEVSKKGTYISFGVRFENHWEISDFFCARFLIFIFEFDFFILVFEFHFSKRKYFFIIFKNEIMLVMWIHFSKWIIYAGYSFFNLKFTYMYWQIAPNMLLYIRLRV